jgi:hypothetical protein
VRPIFAVTILLALNGCGERRPFPEARFREIAKRCGYTTVTYTPAKRKWVGIEAPFIDFSEEADPDKAMNCFEEADLALSKEHASEADLGVTFDLDFQK